MFDVVGKPRDLFEVRTLLWPSLLRELTALCSQKCISSGFLKVAASYLLVLHNLEPLEQSSKVRLLQSLIVCCLTARRRTPFGFSKQRCSQENGLYIDLFCFTCSFELTSCAAMSRTAAVPLQPRPNRLGSANGLERRYVDSSFSVEAANPKPCRSSPPTRSLCARKQHSPGAATQSLLPSPTRQPFVFGSRTTWTRAGIPPGAGGAANASLQPGAKHETERQYRQTQLAIAIVI